LTVLGLFLMLDSVRRHGDRHPQVPLPMGGGGTRRRAGPHGLGKDASDDAKVTLNWPKMEGAARACCGGRKSKSRIRVRTMQPEVAAKRQV
jgi:hypothetical protein